MYPSTGAPTMTAILADTAGVFRIRRHMTADESCSHTARRRGRVPLYESTPRQRFEAPHYARSIIRAKQSARRQTSCVVTLKRWSTAVDAMSVARATPLTQEHPREHNQQRTGQYSLAAPDGAFITTAGICGPQHSTQPPPLTANPDGTANTCFGNLHGARR